MSGPADWIVSHPRLGAGLWFGSCLVLGSLAYLLAVEAILLVFFGPARAVRPVPIAPLGACFLAATWMGSIIGRRLVTTDPAPAASDGYRVGAVVGLCSGLVSSIFVMLTRVWSLWLSGGRNDRFNTGIAVIGLAFLTSVT